MLQASANTKTMNSFNENIDLQLSSGSLVKPEPELKTKVIVKKQNQRATNNASIMRSQKSRVELQQPSIPTESATATVTPVKKKSTNKHPVPIMMFASKTNPAEHVSPW